MQEPEGGRDRAERGVPQEEGPGAAGTAVGIVGLGTIGGAMARHLLGAGYRVFGYDVAKEAMDAFAEAGGRPCDDAAAVAEAAAIVLTSLPSVSAFEQVIGGPRGLCEARSGAFVVAETSTLPLECKEWGRARLVEAGRDLLDCPISGTGAQMATKDAVFYASGAPEGLAMARPVLEAASREVFELGSFGNGTRLKLVANLLVAIHNASTAEALLLADRAGISLEAAMPALLAGAGSSRILELRGPMMAAGRYRPATMKVEVFQKDLDIITEFARKARCPVPVFAAAAQLNVAALAGGDAEADTASVHAALRRLAGE